MQITTHRIQRQQTLNWKRFLLYSIPVLVCILIMIPRLASPSFGLMDDGYNLGKAIQIDQGDLSLNYDGITGRYRPVYWLYYALIYGLVGLNPLWYFAANTLIFCFITVSLIYLVAANQGTWLQAWTAGMIFALAVPNIENLYTLGKGEPLQFFFIMLGFLLLNGLPRIQSARGRWIRIALACLPLFFATLTKETTLLIVPIFAANLGIEWFHQKILGKRRETGSATSPDWSIRFFAAAVAGILCAIGYLIARTLLAGAEISTGTYTHAYGFGLDKVVPALLRWAGWIFRDFPYLFALAGLLLVFFIAKRRFPHWRLYVYTLIWMAAWVAFYLPWRFSQEYYLLPFALGAAVLCGSILSHTVHEMLQTGFLRWVSISLIGLAAGLFAITLLTNLTNARIQLTVDQTNIEMLDYLEANLPPNSVLVVNIRDPNEYLEEIRIHLNEIRPRPDIRVDFVRGQGLARVPDLPASYFILTPTIQNQVVLSVRMGVIESTMKDWNAALIQEVGSKLTPVYRIENDFKIFHIDLPRIFCPILKNKNFCATPQPILDQRQFQYGWEIYQVTR